MTQDFDKVAREIADWLRQNMDITSPTSCWETEDELMRKISEALQVEYERGKKEREDGSNPLAGNPLEWFCDKCRPIAIEHNRQAFKRGLERALGIAEKLPPSIHQVMIMKAIRKEIEGGGK